MSGGFPCQSFSQRGEQLGLGDARGQLYKEILRVLTACRPKCFILENVEGLVHMDGAARRIISLVARCVVHSSPNFKVSW